MTADRFFNFHVANSLGCGLILVLLDENLTIKEANTQFFELFGEQTDESSFTQPGELRNRLNTEEFNKIVSFLHAPDEQVGHSNRTVEFCIEVKDGKTKWISLLSGPILPDNKCICVLTDITQRKEHEHRLAYEISDHEEIFRLNEILTGRYDIPTKTIYFHPETARVFGTDLVYTNFPDSFVNSGKVTGHIEHFLKFYEAINQGERYGRQNTEMVIANGETRLYNRQFKTVFDEEGNPKYALISLLEITEQREQRLAYEKWRYISKSLKTDNIHYYDYNMTRDTLDAIDGNSPSIYPDQNERTFTSVAYYVATNIIHPDDREEYFRVFNVQRLLECFERGETEIITHHRRKAADGSYFHAQGVIQLYKDPFNGDILSFVVIKDIEDELAQMRQALQIEARDDLNNSIPGGIIYAFDRPGFPFYSVNKGLLDYLGYSEQDLEEVSQGLSINFVHPDDRERVEEEIRTAMLSHKQFKVEHRLLTKSDELKWVINRGRKNVDRNGNSVLVMIYTDVTETVRLQNELRSRTDDLVEKHYELQTLAENVPGGVAVLKHDRMGTLLYANQAFFELYGYTAEQARDELDNQWTLAIHPADRDYAMAAIDNAVKSRDQRFEYEVRANKRDGHVIWIMVRGAVVERAGIYYIHCVTLDITSKKLFEEIQLQHEKALQAAVLAAEEATKMKSAFLANMSHEIRTPMNGVIGFAELALDDTSLSEKTREYLNKIRLSATGLMDIINDILDLSKIEAGKMELEEVAFSLHDVFKQCETISSVRAEEKGVMLYFYSEPYVGKKLVGDPTKLRQILLNLLSNAIKFTHRGMVKLLAAIEESDDEQVVIHFEVKDSGIGMTSEQIAKIFEPFAQADNSTTRKYGGTGLGLAITKNIIEMMKGHLKVESTVGLGSKFSFSIPFRISDQAAGKPCNGNTQNGEILRPLFKGEILVCEDNVINQDVISDHLTKLGLKVVIAANGQAGVKMVEKRKKIGKPFDLILMDIHMPVMDGLEATSHLIKMGIKTPIIALTANAMEKDRNIYLASGMADYVAKPFNGPELWASLLKFLTPISMVQHDAEPKPPKKTKSWRTNDSNVIDDSLGMERAAHDEKLYRRVQTGFLKNNRNTFEKLSEAIRNDAIKEAHRIAHSLKGNAGMLGAVDLAEKALEVENSLAGDTINTTADQLYALKSALDHVIDHLVTILLPEEQNENADEQQVQENSEEEITLTDENKQQISDQLEILMPLIKAGNTECIDHMEKFLTVAGPLKREATLLSEQVDDFDFDAATETIELIHQIVQS